MCVCMYVMDWFDQSSPRKFKPSSPRKFKFLKPMVDSPPPLPNVIRKITRMDSPIKLTVVIRI